MSTTEECPEPIDPPTPNRKADVARAAVRGVLSTIPVIGSPLSEIANLAMPDPTARDRARWEIEITTHLNRLAAASGRPQISRDSLSWQLALFANERDLDANGDVAIDESAVCVRFPDISASCLDDALSDLSNADWISCWPDANSRTGVGGFHTKALLFAYTDPVIRRTSPVDDAKLAACFVMTQESEEAVSAEMIEENMGWDARRLYPALAFLAEQVLPEGSVETYYNPRYPFIWLYLNGNSRRSLRQFIGD